MVRHTHWNPMDDLMKGMQVVQGYYDTQERRELRREEAERAAERHDLNMASTRQAMDLRKSQEERATEQHALSQETGRFQLDQAQAQAELEESGRRINALVESSMDENGVFQEDRFLEQFHADPELSGLSHDMVQQVSGDPNAQFLGFTDELPDGTRGVRIRRGNGEQDVLAESDHPDAEIFQVDGRYPGNGLAAIAYYDPEAARSLAERQLQRRQEIGLANRYAELLDLAERSQPAHEDPQQQFQNRELERANRQISQEIAGLERSLLGRDAALATEQARSALEGDQPMVADAKPRGLESAVEPEPVIHSPRNPAALSSSGYKDADPSRLFLFSPAVRAAEDARDQKRSEPEPQPQPQDQGSTSPFRDTERIAAEREHLVGQRDQLERKQQQVQQYQQAHTERQQQIAQQRGEQQQVLRGWVDALRRGEISREDFEEHALPLLEPDQPTTDRTVQQYDEEGNQWEVFVDEQGNEINRMPTGETREGDQANVNQIMKINEYLGNPPELVPALLMDNQGRGIAMNDADAAVALGRANEVLQSGAISGGLRRIWPGIWGTPSSVEDYSIAEMSLASAAANMDLEWPELQKDFLEPIAGLRERGQVNDVDRVLRGVEAVYMELVRGDGLPAKEARDEVRRLLADPQAAQELQDVGDLRWRAQ